MMQDIAANVGGMENVHPGMLAPDQQPPEFNGMPSDFTDSDAEGNASSEDEHFEDYHIDGYHPVHIK